MRIENSMRNSFFGITKIAIRIIFQFITRTVFIKVLGEQLLGLDSLYASILQMLSLAELGIGTAIMYSMYKPAAEGDEKKLASLLRLYRSIYFVIGIIVLVAGLCVMPFLKFFVDKSVHDKVNVYIIFFVVLINTVVGYFFSYKRVLLYVQQRNDIESKFSLLFLILLNIAQILFLLLLKSYYLYVIVLPVLTFIENLSISLCVNKMYPNIKNGEKLSKQEVKGIRKNIYALLAHKVGGVIVSSTDNIFMAGFIGLVAVGLYNNYFMIISAVMSIIRAFIHAMMGSIGNSVALESVEKNYSDFKNLNFLNSWVNGFCAICLFVLLQPFVSDIWLSQTYLLNISVIVCMSISFYLQQSRNILIAYRDVTGNFYADRYKPLIEASVNLVLSLILVNFLGIVGIILGTILSQVLVSIPVEIYIIFKKYFKKSMKKYILVTLINFVSTASVGFLVWYLCSLINFGSGWSFVLKALICVVVINICFFLMSFWRKEYKYFSGIVKRIFNKIFRRRAKAIETPCTTVENSSTDPQLLENEAHNLSDIETDKEEKEIPKIETDKEEEKNELSEIDKDKEKSNEPPKREK